MSYKSEDLIDKLFDVKFAESEVEHYYQKVMRAFGNNVHKSNKQTELIEKLCDLILYLAKEAPPKEFGKYKKKWIENQFKFWEEVLGPKWLEDLKATEKNLKDMLRV